ncbi:MAG: signal peptide peptidase SppA [Ignavibacteria bacterium]|nr:signal peptide peptidase SppA [Ignavibacteria bacterium]MBI3766454.1 signal peptide peptidase SppA [Ignavibacteriales bacterium]
MNKSTRWFIIIIALLLFIGFGTTLFFFLIYWNLSDRDTDFVVGTGAKIAVVNLTGTILTSEETVRQFKKYRDDHSIKGILFRVDSPGGGVVASQEIYEEVKKTRESGKPVVVSMGSLAASGGYYVSCGANRIVANPGTLTGSIGVISQFMHFDPLMNKIGIGVNTIKSGKFKDAGNPFRNMTTADKKYFQTIMDDVHRQFISVVEQERDMEHDSVLAIADGRVFTGEQAVEIGLVDTIGTYEDALAIVAKLAGIRGEPSIVKERKHGLSLFERLFGEAKIPDFLGLKDELLNQPILQYKILQGY